MSQKSPDSYTLDGYELAGLPSGLGRFGVQASSSGDNQGNKTSHISWVRGPGVVYGKVASVRSESVTDLDSLRDAHFAHLDPAGLERVTVEGREAYHSAETGDVFWVEEPGSAVTVFLLPERWDSEELLAFAGAVSSVEPDEDDEDADDEEGDEEGGAEEADAEDGEVVDDVTGAIDDEIDPDDVTGAIDDEIDPDDVTGAIDDEIDPSDVTGAIDDGAGVGLPDLTGDAPLDLIDDAALEEALLECIDEALLEFSEEVLEALEEADAEEILAEAGADCAEELDVTDGLPVGAGPAPEASSSERPSFWSFMPWA